MQKQISVFIWKTEIKINFRHATELKLEYGFSTSYLSHHCLIKHLHVQACCIDLLNVLDSALTLTLAAILNFAAGGTLKRAGSAESLLGHNDYLTHDSMY